MLTAAVFLTACLVMERHGGAHRAWEILIGVRSPFGQAWGLGTVLSALGYAFVPIALGLAAADAVARFIDKRLQTLQEAEANIIEKAGRALAAAEAAKTQAPPPGSAHA